MREQILKQIVEIDAEIDTIYRLMTLESGRYSVTQELWNKKVGLQKRKGELLKELYKILPVTIEGTLASSKDSDEEDEYFFLGETFNGSVVYNPLGDITEFLNANRKKRVKITIEIMDDSHCNDCASRYSCWTDKA